jgi:hypothetical protein
MKKGSDLAGKGSNMVGSDTSEDESDATPV